MKRVRIFAACLFAFLSVNAFAQNVKVKGTVVDISNDEPIAGAAVVAKGASTSYALTDQNGAFSITVAKDAVLVVSSMGYSTQEVPVGNGGDIKVSLYPDSEYLDEVVVTAQGLTRKQKAIGYSAQVIGEEGLTLTHSSELGNSLAGKVAGAQLWASGGSTFSEGKIILRGPTSYSNQEGSEPIYVIDGAITTASAVNMDDVESINILKGPAATAMYGSRGANGAIIITTKRARDGQSHIEFSHTTSAEFYYNHVKFQKLYGGGAMGKYSTKLFAAAGDPDIDVLAVPTALASFALGDGTYTYDYGEDASWGPRFDNTSMVRSALSWDPTSSKYGVADPWSYRLNLADLTRVAWINTTSIAFTKSTKGMNTRVSFTNVDRPGIYYNSKAVRRSFSVSSQIKPVSWLNADISYRYRYRQNANAGQEGYNENGSYFFDLIQWGHTNVDLKELKDWKRPDGTWRNWNIVSTTDLSANFHDNPFAVMDNYTYTNTTQYHIIAGDVYATLPLNIRLGVRVNDIISGQKYEEKDASGSKNFESLYRIYFAQSNDLTGQAYLTWSGNFVDDKLTIEAAAFAEARKYDYHYLNSRTNGGLSVDGLYNLSSSNKTYVTNNSESHFKTRSFFATATIGWDDLVYLDGSFRYDIDSRLPAQNNAYPYGGASVSFMASKLINAPWLNFWKIRGSLAQVGSTIDPYTVLPSYSMAAKKHNLTTLYEDTTQLNPNIQPTISTSYEVGTEFKMFNNRFWGDINLYLKNTKNDIIEATSVPQAGYAARYMNAGLVQNKGIEIMLGGTPIKTKDWEWTLNGNISRNINTLVELTPDQTQTDIWGNAFYYEYTLKAIAGQPIGSIATAARFNRNEAGQLILTDATPDVGDVRPTWTVNDTQISGNIQPKFIGGFGTSVRYKDFTLAASIDFMVGGQFVSWTNMWGEGSGTLDVTAAVNDRGVNVREPVQKGGGVHLIGVDADGNPKDGYIDAARYFEYKYMYDQPSTIYDRTYVKLREVSLRYDLPKSVLNKVKFISQASVALVATNPWLIYSACPNVDPSEIGGADYNFIEGGQAPSTRQFGITLNVTF